MELIYTERAFLDGPIQSHGIVGMMNHFGTGAEGVAVERRPSTESLLESSP